VLKGLIYRVVGAPPAAGATRKERLCWVRKFYRLNLIAIAVVVLFAVLLGGTFLWIVAAVGTTMWAGGLASITMSIRREEPTSR
jgi:small-conductance mechanosensitive channel